MDSGDPHKTMSSAVTKIRESARDDPLVLTEGLIKPPATSHYKTHRRNRQIDFRMIRQRRQHRHSKQSTGWFDGMLWWFCYLLSSHRCNQQPNLVIRNTHRNRPHLHEHPDFADSFFFPLSFRSRTSPQNQASRKDRLRTVDFESRQKTSR